MWGIGTSATPEGGGTENEVNGVPKSVCMNAGGRGAGTEPPKSPADGRDADTFVRGDDLPLLITQEEPDVAALLPGGPRHSGKPLQAPDV
mmetsp:Transcript_38530/g.81765  ORF Transcript_38530/g.81765 Transcript_38530/m.81765 type:complete len:90 (+) Transcript_38530:236-505(+)